MKTMVKAAIRVAPDWTSMNGYVRNIWLSEQLRELADSVRDGNCERKKILNRNGNTSHIEVKI
jgi:hypothetical protein